MKKLEDTKENKARFFAQYWGQRVLPIKVWGSANYIDYICFKKQELYEHPIELTSLSNLSDKDAIEVAQLLHSGLKRKEALRVGNMLVSQTDEFGHPDYTLFDGSKAIDFLRSKGYAVPYMGLSVQELQERGWLRLSDND